ncbi:uncharacterized protein LOC143883003 [Tasmannia lanceolata]|uniref:uncharacterized protein LOC143883003 n=1 Tax=Tasmannia lanceolata TaxID=3420 RepID=UPI00406307C7
MEALTNVVEVQRLTGRDAVLNRFMSKSVERCQPFFKLLKNIQKFERTATCQESFDSLKQYLQALPVLTKPELGEELFLYLAISSTTVSAALAQQKGKQEHPVYYVSRVLHGAEVRYQNIEKFAYAVVIAAWKLRPYFHAHTIVHLTDQPLWKILQKPETSERLISWAVEMGEFDIQVRPRPAIKSQVLTDFIVEFTAPVPNDLGNEETMVPARSRAADDEPIEVPPLPELEGETRGDAPSWILHVDASTSKAGCGAGIALMGLDEFTAKYALRLYFKASNNEAEYEALLVRLTLTTELGVDKLTVYSDTQLVVGQVKGTYVAKELRMMKYLEKVKEKMAVLKEVEILQIPRGMNARADTLS